MIIMGLLLAVLIGLTVGLLGGGGAILAVPIFVYVLGFGTKEAVAMSLIVVGVTSLSGVVEHWREGRVRPRVALIFGIFAMAGAYLGAWLAVFFSGAVQLILLAVVMVVAAFFMFRDDNKPDEDEANSESSFVMKIPIERAAGLAVLGVVIGLLTGLVGVGGGFLIVPGLTLLGQVSAKEAVGTSLLVIALNSASGFVGYLGKVEIQWAFMALFAAVAVVGSLAGAYLVRFIPSDKLQKVFAIFLALMAMFIFYQNLGTFF